MAKKVQLQTNGKEWQTVDGVEVLVDVEKQDIDPITSSSCVQIEGFRTLEEAVSDNKMLSQDLTYTKVMDKVGGDYHQNVLDGQYSKAILYGNTQVNLCEEDSSVALQIPTTFTSFNNGELQINNKESQVVAPLIKGVTMVNLAQTNSASLASSESVAIENVKGNTLYTLSFKFTTKNTNSGVTIESYNGDTYLENTMHKTGLGDDVKFTFTTHANATKVHICNNAAYGGETIQLDDIMVIEGDQTALDIPFFKGMKSVELVRPLTNLFTDSLVTTQNSSTHTNNGGTVTVTSTSSAVWCATSFYFDFKPNTKYVLMWDSLSYTQSSTTYNNSVISICRGTNIIYNMESSQFTTKRSILFATADEDTTKTVVRIHATTSNTETGTTTVTGLRIFEYDDYLRSVDLQSIGWFSGAKNVTVEPVKTYSKNLYPYGDVSFTSSSTGWHDAKGNANMYGDIAQKSKTRFLLKKGTYYLSMGAGTNITSVHLVDDKEQMYSYTPLVLDKDTYLTVRVQTTEANVATTLTNIQIERGETATAYVAHDSRYYEPDGQNAIVLRSLPNGVCDTFNLQTGEYTRRIGEAILDGSDNGIIYTHNGDASSGDVGVNTCRWYARNNSEPIKNVSNEYVITNAICDKLKYSYMYKGEQEQDYEAFFISSTSNRIFFRTEKSKLNSLDVEGIKQYLQQNPITVQYELETPITTIIPRTIKRNNNGTVSTADFKTYTNKESLVLPKNPTFLTINGMTSIKPVVEPITYVDFKTRLKANTDYSVIIDKDSANKTINLGGTPKTYADKMLVRTPSINLEQNLRISGSGSIQNIMVIEGDVLDKELPYFNGMCNVKMPIVRNMGRNLFDIQSIYQGLKNIAPNHVSLSNDNALRIKSTNLWHEKDLGKPIKFKKNTRYTLSFNAQDINNIGGLPDTIICFVYTDGTTSFSRAWGDNVCTSTAGKTVDYINFSFGYGYGGRMAEFSNFMLVEGTEAQLYEPYKENSVYAVQGEIPFSEDMFEQGGFSGDSGNTYDNCKANTNTNIRMRTKGLITVKPNTTYIVNNNASPNMNHVFYLFDESQKYLGSNTTVNTKSFATPNNCRYVSLMFSKDNNANISVSEFKQEYFQLLELDSTVQLRSLPNGVKDELNLLTGEYIQRVGEVVLDGSENEGWNIGASSNANLLDFYIHNIIPNALNNGDGISDKFNYINQVWYVKVAGICVNLDKGISMMLPTKYVKTQDLQGCLEWLSQNPITVQYELAEPIISYPRIVSNTQEREVGVKLPNGICDTYNPSTGITVKRVGKVVLDGSENWVLDTTKTNTQVFSLDIKDLFIRQDYTVICNSLPTSNGDNSDTEKISSITSVPTTIFIALLKTKASTVDELKTYLASNPITVWYELKNPIVTTDIVLPNGVHDDYNPITGLYTKRVMCVEFDGSDDENWSLAGTKPFAYAMLNPIAKTHSMIANNLPINSNIATTSTDLGCIIINPNSEQCLLRVRTQDILNGQTITDFKTYLSQNPLKVWYELSTPITYQLTPYFGLPMPYAYKDGYLIMDSAYDGQTLPPEITYQLTVNRTGQITQNNIKLKEHTARLSNLEYILIEATLDSIFSREMQNFELELMNVELFNLDE